MFYSVAETSFH